MFIVDCKQKNIYKGRKKTTLSSKEVQTNLVREKKIQTNQFYSENW
jgi:hypothetical protein